MAEKKRKRYEHGFRKPKLLVKRLTRSIYAARSLSGKRVLVKVNQNREEARREATVMRLYGKSPHLVRLYDYYELDKKGYIIMQWLPGKNLSALIRSNGAFPVSVAVRISLQILTGLTVLHDLGYVHGDLHAGNIMVRRLKENPKATIIDMQLAVKKREGGKARARRLLTSPPAHLAPESTRWIDERYDLYGAGFILGSMLVGSNPKQPFTHFPDTGTEAPLWQVVRRAVDPEPAHRYASAREMADALRAAVRAMCAGEQGAQ